MNFGRSPLLPIDIIIGRPQCEKSEGGEVSVPQYVQALGRSLRKIYNNVKRMDTAHERSKNHYDKGVSGEKFAVGDQVWLYVPAVKQGKTKKLS